MDIHRPLVALACVPWSKHAMGGELIMCSQRDCERYVGQWVQFSTPYGVHRGILERVTQRHAIVLSPRQYIPAQFATESLKADEEKRIDAVLASGYGPYGGGYGWGYPGAYWGRWAVSFLIIFTLLGLGLWW
ncbi:hypothetical protein [Alicyclobacillus kakegawensis]|uniref:hypothetical protein n=1 Tax=Alicyclobacillus kakegawensis TaxID=392012 RepID=UPI001FE2370B|nr:hypothetical protein [Alicyclobacillus kakegawensis]